MSTTISNNGLPPLAPPANGTNNGQAASAGTSTSTAGASTRADDQLKLSDSAHALQDAARANDAAVVDQQRVDRIRQALADGTYTINPTQIAEHMLALEQQIGGTGQS